MDSFTDGLDPRLPKLHAEDRFFKVTKLKPLNDILSRACFENTCNFCHQPALKKCTGCKGAPAFGNESSHIVYCSSVCQKADFASHKLVCKSFRSRKALFRAGGILQESFYIFREALFDKRIHEIEEMEGEIRFHESYCNPKLVTRVDCLEQFVPHLCRTEEIKKGILSSMMCDESVAWFHDMSKYIFQDFVTHVKEEDIFIQDIKLRFLAVDPLGQIDRREYCHSLWRVKIKPRGEEYIVDLTGAQFGWKNTVMPFSEFAQTRIKRLITNPSNVPNVYGGEKERLLKVIDKKNAARSALTKISSFVSQDLKTTVIGWESQMNSKVKFILQLPEDGFAEAKGQLLQLIKKGVEDSVKRLASAETVSLPIAGGRFLAWGDKGEYEIEGATSDDALLNQLSEALDEVERSISP